MTRIEQDVYKVIAYFSFFGYPVTAFEVWKWQLQPEETWSLGQITEVLDQSKALRRLVFSHHGHYGIGDVKEQVATRHDHYLEAVKKYKKLKRILAYVTRIPSVQGVALCNTLPFHFTRAQSDIDLFLVTDDGRLWSARFSAVAPMLLLKQRPGEVGDSPVDMSFFVARAGLNLSELRLPEGDPYFSFWVQSLVPVYESDPGLFRALMSQNTWAQSDLPATRPMLRARSSRYHTRGSLPLTVSESWAKDLSLKRLPTHLKDRANQDSCVVMTESVLKFHSTDRREDIRKHLAACLEQVG